MSSGRKDLNEPSRATREDGYYKCVSSFMTSTYTLSVCIEVDFEVEGGSQWQVWQSFHDKQCQRSIQDGPVPRAKGL